MRTLAALTSLVLALSSISAATPLDAQVIMPGYAISEKSRWSYTVCEVEDSTVKIDSIEVTPDPPEPGKDLTVNVKARAEETIQDGASADVTVFLGRIKLLRKTFDLCEEARNANATVQCPVEPGLYDVQQTVTLPKEIPRAKFRVHIDAIDQDYETLFCLDLHADFLPRFPHRS